MIIDLTKKLDKIFHDRVRLGVMSLLMARDEISFSEMVKILDVTRGNLSAHLKTLEKNQLIKSKKVFVDNKPRTTYRATAKGKKAFENYLGLLEEIVKGINK